jgi:hypothetical protein
LTTIIVSGCSGSLLSASGPDYKSLIAATDNDEVDFEIIDLSPSTIGPYLLTPTPINQQMMQGRMLGPRSEVILQRNRQSFIAMGAVSTPGLFDMPSSHPSLLQVLGVVGGLQQSTADPSGVFVFRRAGFAEDGKPIALVFRLDMSRPEAIMLASAFQVKPEDALYVTNAGVYQAQKVIAPIVQMIILGNTVTGSN